MSVKRLGIDVPLLVLILAARGFEETALLQQANGLAREAIEEKTKLILRGRRSRKKVQATRATLMVDAIEHQKVKMGMKIRAAAETLDEKNTSQESARQVRKEASIVTRNRAAGDGDDRVEELATMGDPEAKRDGNRRQGRAVAGDDLVRRIFHATISADCHSLSNMLCSQYGG